MYYLIETEYVGFSDTIRGPMRRMSIQTVPGTTNMSHEERVDGWLGTTNDYSETACGEYDTLEDARAAAARLGYTQRYDEDEDERDRSYVYDEDIVDVYVEEEGDEV